MQHNYNTINDTQYSVFDLHYFPPEQFVLQNKIKVNCARVRLSTYIYVGRMLIHPLVILMAYIYDLWHHIHPNQHFMSVDN